MKHILITICLAILLGPAQAWAISKGEDSDNQAVNYDYPFYESASPNDTRCVGKGADVLEGHNLPATKGGTGLEEAMDENGRLIRNGAKLALANRAYTKDEQDYYITMRWRYVKWYWNGTSASGSEKVDFYQKNPKVLVTNPRTKKSIIAIAIEAGPAPWTGTPHDPGSPPSYWDQPQDGTPRDYKGRVSGLPPVAFKALGAAMRMQDGSGDDLLYSWAPDQNAKPGPVSTPSSVNTDDACDVAAANILQYKPRLRHLASSANIKPTAIVLHWWAGLNEGEGIAWLANILNSRKLSVQFGALRDGRVYQMTKSPASHAQHAFCANEYAIGIEIEGRGPEDLASSKEQFEAVVSTVKYLMDKYNIPLEGAIQNPSSQGAIGVHSHKDIDAKCPKGSGKQDVDDEYMKRVKEALKEG